MSLHPENTLINIEFWPKKENQFNQNYFLDLLKRKVCQEIAILLS